eukprot:5819965-Pleurochrysis_carterae.AAC.1
MSEQRSAKAAFMHDENCSLKLCKISSFTPAERPRSPVVHGMPRRSSLGEPMTRQVGMVACHALHAGPLQAWIVVRIEVRAVVWAVTSSRFDRQVGQVGEKNDT